MIHARSDETAWEAQREAQRLLSPQERLVQNDALTRLFVASAGMRRPRRIG